MEVLNKRLCDEEFGECDANGGRCVISTETHCRKAGKVEVKELDEGLVGCGVADGYGYVDTGQCFAECMRGG